jgi:uncharacterized membrane protein (Fun14 family)
MSMEIISSLLASQLAIGGLVGFLIGFAFKKITKIAFVLAAVFFVSIAYLEYNKVVTLNYEQFEVLVNNIIQKAGANFVLPSFLAMNLPLLVSFGGAMVYGLKKG